MIKFSPTIISDKFVLQYIDYQTYLFCLSTPLNGVVGITELQERLNFIIESGKKINSFSEVSNYSIPDEDKSVIERAFINAVTCVYIEGDKD